MSWIYPPTWGSIYSKNTSYVPFRAGNSAVKIFQITYRTARNTILVNYQCHHNDTYNTYVDSIISVARKRICEYRNGTRSQLYTFQRSRLFEICSCYVQSVSSTFVPSMLHSNWLYWRALINFVWWLIDKQGTRVL